MILSIPDILSPEELALGRKILEQASWIDGGVTAGHQSSLVKNNLQLPQESEASRKVGEMILRGLARSPLFMSAALPKEIFPPLFNRYASGHDFGTHVDNAIRQTPGGAPLRTDLSATLFLADPASYDGGELEVEDGSASHRFKLAAGSMLLYPATTLHRVTPVTKGVRRSMVGWIVGTPFV